MTEGAHIGAWAQSTPNETLLKAILAPWQGRLGVVLGQKQELWNAGQAFTILNHPTSPLNTRPLAILGSRDEPNVTGASGHRQEPGTVISDTLTSRERYPGAPVTTGALAFVGNWWRQAFSHGRFDAAYWQQISGIGGPWAFNAGGSPRRLLEQPLTLDAGPWIVCGVLNRPAWRPYNTVLAWLARKLLGTGAATFVRLADREDVLAVTFWVLLQTSNPDGSPQTAFGIYKPRGTAYVLTTVGRELWRAVMRNRRYPVVELA